MNNTFYKNIAVAAMSAMMFASPIVVMAVEDGLGTNVIHNIRIQDEGGIELDAERITAWQGLTNDAILGAVYNRRDIGVTNINANTFNQFVVTNLAQGAVSNVNIGAGAVTSNKIDWTQMPAGLVDGTVASNWAKYPALQNVDMGGNSISNSPQVSRWDNAVIMKEGAGAITYSNLYYYNGANWVVANASTSTTAKGMLGLALGANVANDGLLLNGHCTNAWGFTAGSIIYMDTNNGALAESRPTGTNNIVRIVGYAVSSSKIFFNPDRTFIEILGD